MLMRSYIGEYRNVCGNFHPAWTGLQRGRAWHSICAHYGKMQFSNRTNDCRFNFRVISSVISRFMTIAQFFGILHSLHYSIWVAVFTFSSEQKPYYYGFMSFFWHTYAVQRKGAKIRLIHVIHSLTPCSFCGFKYYVLNSIKRMRYFIWPFQTKSDAKCELWTYDK